MGNQLINIDCYADDAVLLADNEDNLQRLLYTFQQSAKEYNMEISTTKTKSLVISKEPIRCKLVVENHPIEQVMSFQYLGVNTTSDRNLISEVRSQTTKFNNLSGCLRDVIWKNKFMLNQNKDRIYKNCIRPIITCD